MRILLLFILLGTIPLSGQNSSGVDQLYQPTVFPKDTSQLWIGDGDLTSDTVLIVGEGGPKRHLDFEANGRVYWEYLPGQDHYYVAVVHQSSTYNATIFGATDFTLEDAQKEVDNTSEILYRAIKYFKDRNKYVVVLGHSYSAFVIPHYLSTRPSLANKYLITGGRLDANLVQTAYQLKGLNSGFEEDGQTLIEPDENTTPNLYRRVRYRTIRKNKELLKYAIGKPRYTELLKDLNLANLVFYYGMKDQNVGALSTTEVQFLKNKGAIVFGVDCDHYTIWQRVIDAFRDGSLQF
ncbi:MAG: hypothetical protein Sapg2KO_13460 [Saprospiraceae bacterium]